MVYLKWFWDHWEALLAALKEVQAVVQDGSKTALDAKDAEKAIVNIFDSAAARHNDVVTEEPEDEAESNAMIVEGEALLKEFGPTRHE